MKGREDRDPENRETNCHDWGLGPQIGDRSAQYRGRNQANSGVSYKGSIREIPRPALGSGGQFLTSTNDNLHANLCSLHTFLQASIC